MGFVASGRYTDDGISDYWRLNDVFTVKQAALLIVGCDPASEAGSHCQSWKPHERPEGYEAAKQALVTNLESGVIQGLHYPCIEYDINGNPVGELDGTTDIDRSTVLRHSVAKWITGRGITTGFFQVVSAPTVGYLDSANARYAPKLAAAISAWQAVTDPNGKSPKQALVKWLREHASEFGLSDEDGKPNEQGIEEVAKVANWQPGGGAARTPGT